MERSDEAVELWGTSTLQEDIEQPFSANQVEGLGQVERGDCVALCISPVVVPLSKLQPSKFTVLSMSFEVKVPTGKVGRSLLFQCRRCELPTRFWGHAPRKF